jgi:GTP pyrophosphokinase
MIVRAIRLATTGHDGIFRKYEPEPYIYHPLRVFHTLVALDDDRLTEEAFAAAILHDGIEDTNKQTKINITYKMLYQKFGAVVADYVKGMTNPSQDPENMKKLRAERKKIDRAHLATQPEVVKMIKLADRTDNLRSLNNAPLKFRRLYYGESVLLFEVLKGVSAELDRQMQEVLDKTKVAIGED